MDIFGLRTYKYNYLNNTIFSTINWKQIFYEPPYYFFVPKNLSAKQQYEAGFSISELFVINNSGIGTDRDTLFIDTEKSNLSSRIQILLSGNYSDNFTEEFRVKDSSSYKITSKIKGANYDSKHLNKIIYRPFDIRWIYYDKNIISRPAYDTMKEFFYENIGICVKRGFDDTDAIPIFCCDQLMCRRGWSRPGSLGSEYIFPLFKYSHHLGKLIKSPNFNTSIINKIENSLNIKLNNGFNPLDLLDYIYAVLHCGKYINKYREFIKIEFPRVPYPTDQETFWKLVEIGSKLRECHLMHTEFDIQPYNLVGYGTNEVVKPEYKNGRVYISKTQYFDNVPQAQWEQYIGGYQPLQKWLKDRKKTILSSEDIEHYKKIIAALKLTQELMAEIDNIVDF